MKTPCWKHYWAATAGMFAFAILAGLPAGVRADPVETSPQESESPVVVAPADPVMTAEAPRPRRRPMATDRPDQAETSDTVGQWVLQIESAVDIETTRSGGVRLVNIRTPVKIRFGVLDPLELHLETDGFATDRQIGGPGGGKSVHGFSYVGVGFKARLVDEGYWRGALPSLSLLVSLDLPTGTKGYSSDGVNPRAALLADWGLPAGMGLGFNLGAEVPRGAGGRYVQGFFALALSRDWAPLSDRVSTYIELFGDLSFSGAAGNALAFSGGFAFQLTDDIQLDLSARAGILGDMPDAAAALGFSFRR